MNIFKGGFSLTSVCDLSKGVVFKMLFGLYFRGIIFLITLLLIISLLILRVVADEPEGDLQREDTLSDLN